MAGEISVMQDVVIEELRDSDVTVVASMPVARGEQMLLHVEHADGDGTTLVVQGCERRAVVVNGRMRHRLRLRIVRTHRNGPA